jgi:hypothetical protein
MSEYILKGGLDKSSLYNKSSAYKELNSYKKTTFDESSFLCYKSLNPIFPILNTKIA